MSGATFKLQSGETLLLKGSNGAGKTTLLRALAGLLPISGGRVLLAPAVKASPSELRAAAIYVGHTDGVKSAMTAAEHLLFWSRLYPGGAARIDAAVAAFGLDDLLKFRTGALSAGQRRRVALARLVISGKPIWLLDEPGASMDAESNANLIALVLAHNARGGAAVIATHDRIAITARTLVVERAPQAA